MGSSDLKLNLDSGMNSPEYPNPIGYYAPQSVWELIEERVPEHEREEIKRMLGYSKVEESLDLHKEVGYLKNPIKKCIKTILNLNYSKLSP